MTKCKDCFVFLISEIDKFQPHLRWCEIKRTWVQDNWDQCLNSIKKTTKEVL